MMLESMRRAQTARTPRQGAVRSRRARVFYGEGGKKAFQAGSRIFRAGPDGDAEALPEAGAFVGARRGAAMSALSVMRRAQRAEAAAKAAFTGHSAAMALFLNIFRKVCCC